MKQRGGFCILLFSICLMSVGCLPEIKSSYDNKQPAEAAVILEDCRALQGQGDVRLLVSSIRNKKEELINLSNQEMTEEVSAKAHVIAESIQALAGQLINILDSDFTQAKFEQRLRWQIQPQDYKYMLSEYNQANAVIVGASADAVYSWNAQDEKLRQDVLISHDQQSVQVEFRRPASAVELCQLQSLFVIVLKIDLESRYSKKTLKFKLTTKSLGEL